MARNELRQFTVALLTLVAQVWLTGCATGSMGVRRSTVEDQPEGSGGLHDGGGGGFGWTKGDDFQQLQESAGLEEEDWHEAGEELESGDARALWETLLRTETTLRNFAPRRSLFFLLGQVLAQGEEVSYAQLLERVHAMRFLVVMRADGYLAGALNGKPLQRSFQTCLRRSQRAAPARA